MKATTSSKLRGLWAAVTAACLLIACGGGVDSGGTGNGMTANYASGAITGLGSIFVNGVRYDVDQAGANGQILDDEGTAHPGDDLQIGMITDIVASAPAPAQAASGLVATASSVRYRSQLIGPVQAVDAAGNLTVLEQQVRFVAGKTAQAGTPKIGDVVEVFAQFDTRSSAYVATRIQGAAGAAVYKVRGTVTALSLPGKTFDIGALRISYAGLTLADPASALAVGRLLRVRLATTPVGGIWQATALESGQADIADREFAEVEGRITAFVNVRQFSLDGMPVDASNATLPANTAGIVSGARVEVEGSIRNGTLVASRVKVEDDEGEDPEGVELHGSISVANASARTFVVRGQTVHYGNATVFEEGSSAADIVNGRQIEVRGALSSDGMRIEATRINVER